MPPDVRRWLCPAERSQVISRRAMPWSVLGPDWLRRGRIEGVAQNMKGTSTAGHSHRRTSGGKAHTFVARDF
ncbi:MAG: hypothetical protein QOF62_212 [Pyrinomonadaceae bacterium]|jgi:hypothetical protein|nr:hypothetical protein [Pyrinomonadaceae bacterium]